MSASTRKHKLPSPLDDDEPNPVPEVKRRRKASRSKQDEDEDRGEEKTTVEEEKRLRRFRANAPASFNIIHQRATEQRFYVINRERCGTADCPEERVDIAGSTGNIYTVHIAQIPSCNCPHALKGNQCKHVIYVMCRVLRARFDLVYQLALLSTELREIFEKAPPIVGIDGDGNGGKQQDGNRKEIEGDCPICFTPFDSAEDIVYCRATCGQNMHKECLEMWAATKRQTTRDAVTCPMCRSPWQGDEDTIKKKKIKNTGNIGEDGYVNVADQLGISGVRDISTYYDGSNYHRSGSRFGFWGRRRR